ncbi:MAG: putative HTH-type transcriptional regulator ycbG [Solirubrobacterales bacterium]|jgi:GntR family transcriptional repressor for pyruvate dehydrogenase complex|nr:putative HTH-type transcriptional regulator ycbG [Solirubrobacterales bacterium]
MNGERTTLTQPRRRASLELFGPIRTGSAVDAVIDQIVDQIRSGRLPEDMLLPGERQLALAMNVSRRTVREAIEILQDAGVVSVSPGPAGGTRIASIWIPDSLMEDPGGPLSTAEDVFHVLEGRRVIEPRVAQLAALRGTDEDFRIMRETIELQRANQQDRWRVNQANAIFHRQLWRAGGNPELEAAMRSIYRRLSGVFFAALEQDETSDSTAIGIDLHEETLEAIMRGRPDEAEEAMDRHLAYLERRCEAAYGRARVPHIPEFLVGRDGETSRPRS